jgi:hypothetical protein
MIKACLQTSKHKSVAQFKFGALYGTPCICLHFSSVTFDHFSYFLNLFCSFNFIYFRNMCLSLLPGRLLVSLFVS